MTNVNTTEKIIGLFFKNAKNLIYLIINILNADWQGTVKMLKKMNLLGFAAVECRPYKLAAAKPF